MSDGQTELPVPDTVDVRSGPDVSEELLSVLPLLGEWHGEGQATGAAGDHRFGQWIRFSHDGRGFLAYESRTWRLTDDGVIVGPDVRESGFWRPRGQDDVELAVRVVVGQVRETLHVVLEARSCPAQRHYGEVGRAAACAVQIGRPDPVGDLPRLEPGGLRRLVRRSRRPVQRGARNG